MTAPVVASRSSTTEASTSTIHSISLGSISVGELLLVMVVTGSSSGALSVHTGISGNDWYTDKSTAGASTLRVAVFWKVAAGSDALTLVSSNSCRIAAECYHITGHGSSVTVAAAASSAGSTNGDPPNVAQSGSAQDTLFLEVLGSAASVASAASTGYATLTTASSSNPFISVAEKTANATFDNPGTFTNTSQEWIATTIAVASTAITTNLRETQEAIETLTAVSPNLVLTQEAIEVVTTTSPNAVITQVAVEVLSANALKMLVTQLAVEMVSTNVPNDSGRRRPVIVIN